MPFLRNGDPFRAAAVAAGTSGIIIASIFLLEPVAAAVSIGLGIVMMAIAIHDFFHFTIPDVLSLPAILSGVLIAPWAAGQFPYAEGVLFHAFAAGLAATLLLALRGLYQLVRRREGLGLGDVKLAAVAGAWNGLGGLDLVFLVACVGAFCYLALTAVFRRRLAARTDMIPLGAFLAPAIWVVWLQLNALQ